MRGALLKKKRIAERSIYVERVGLIDVWGSIDGREDLCMYFMLHLIGQMTIFL